MSKRIVVIDDEKDVCEAIRDTLEFEGFEVKTISSGKEAIEYLKQDLHDLVMIDLRLEGAVSGIDIIRKCGESVKRPKIVIISATPRESLKPILDQEKLSHFVDLILEKPSDLLPFNLTKVLKQLLLK